MNAIFNRRSIRKFEDAPVADGQVELLLRAGMAAPCAKNSQNRIFVVQRGPGALPALLQIHPNAFALKTAPLAITVCADLRKAAEIDPVLDWWVQDCSAALENILIEGAELGLGSLWIGVWPDPKRVKTVQGELALPEHIVPLGVAALGRPAKAKEPCRRYEAEAVFWEKYGEG